MNSFGIGMVLRSEQVGYDLAGEAELDRIQTAVGPKRYLYIFKILEP
jgi:hypothetical protein